MAQVSDLPCDGDGVCMVCKSKAVDGEILTCKTCVTPWHVTCLTARPQTLADAAQWDCPDCSDLTGALDKQAVGGRGGLVEKIRAIESDASLTDREKAKRRQELLCGGAGADDGKGKKDVNNGGGAGGILGIFGDKFNCSICMQLLDRPVSTPCGHNFCLKCFQKWVGQQRKKTCAICRKTIPIWMAREPRINSAIVMAIRMAKSSQPNFSGGPPKTYHFIHNQDRPDKAFTTERAQKSGNANACSGKIFVTIPSDFFGPITAEHDPTRNQGVLVGETWEDRMSCRQWGAHFPHVAGICGQSDYGAQSVALSGGYLDDEDHGEWFLYTGSGGRDLSGNKRTNKNQSFDQKFTNSNEALRVSCLQGYPVRVVRSSKEKRSCYAPSEKGVRYDGVYRVEKCWRKKGGEGFLLCRYLFVRCDNDPAPWTSDNQGDRPRSSLPDIPELKQAINITERKQPPAWDYDEQQGRWIWTRPQPPSRKNQGDYDVDGQCKRKGRRQKQGTKSVKDKLLKEFSCLICRNVMVLPLTTPCAHNFCKACLESTFSGQSIVKERTCGGRRTLRTQKNVMKCPSCKSDISDFLQNPQVNREVMNVIETLQSQVEEEERLKADRSVADVDEEDVDVDAGDDAGDEDMEEEEEESYGMDSDSIDENDHAVAEDKENCDVNAEIPKAEKKGRGRPKKVSDDTKAEPVSEGKRGLSGGAEGGVSKRKKTCSDTETAKAEKPKRSYKRKKAEAH